MTAPTIVGRLSAGWLRAVPPRTLGDVIAYLADSFAELRRLYPDHHSFDQPEPTLTLSLCQHADLQNRKEDAGLSGAFAAESYAPVRDPSGQVRKNGRTDILFTLGQAGAPQVVFEFKKLDGGKRHRDLYIGEGLNRFVTGKYAPDRDQGVMVGLTKVPPGREATAVRLALDQAGAMQAQRCIAGALGGGTRQPSATAPNVADFDTVHDRSGTPHVTPIHVAHAFFDCP